MPPMECGYRLKYDLIKFKQLTKEIRQHDYFWPILPRITDTLRFVGHVVMSSFRLFSTSSFHPVNTFE